jgi:hypothetical protein
MCVCLVGSEPSVSPEPDIRLLYRDDLGLYAQPSPGSSQWQASSEPETVLYRVLLLELVANNWSMTYTVHVIHIKRFRLF